MRDELAKAEDKHWLAQEQSRLSAFLLRMRQARRLTLEEASLTAGLDNKTLSRIEKGEFMPRYITLLYIAKAFDLSPAEFFRALAHFLTGKDAKVTRRCVGRYYSKDRKEWVEIWRMPRGKNM